MLIGDDAAGMAAVEFLIEQEKLEPDFWFRVKINHREDHFTWGRFPDPCDIGVANAVKTALGMKGLELPEWAKPGYKLPDHAWISSHEQNRFPTTEPYHSTGDFRRTLSKCYTGPTLDEENLKIQRGVYKSLAIRSWRRVIPHFNPEVSAQILEIENWPHRLYRGHAKGYEVNLLVEGTMIRGEALRDFYDKQGEEGLNAIFHGLGKRAVYGVGAMLFMSGEHDDLAHTAEKLENLLSKPKPKE